jgi:hypothetical protein
MENGFKEKETTKVATGNLLQVNTEIILDNVANKTMNPTGEDIEMYKKFLVFHGLKRIDEEKVMQLQKCMPQN